MVFTVTDTAQLTGLSRRLVTSNYGLLRSKLARWHERAAPIPGTVEVDESYIRPTHVLGKHCRGIRQPRCYDHRKPEGKTI